MSALSRTSTLVDVPGVTLSVEKLQELAQRMRGQDVAFEERDIYNVDIIIDSINDAYKESEKLHEKLEMESIQASVLRHRLQFMPGTIAAQIQSAVESAKVSNSSEVHRLEHQVVKVGTNIEELEKQFAELEAENAKLYPERDRVRLEHEEIISLLNQRMAEKACRQIKLNETRDKLRDTNQKILDLEDGIVNLKEDMIQERAEARMEKKRLKKAVYDTTIKTREQKEENAVKKKELDVLQKQVRESENTNEIVKDKIAKFDQSRVKLTHDLKRMTKKLEDEKKENISLDEKGGIAEKQVIEAEEEFIVMQENLTKTIKQLEADLKYEEGLNKEQTARKRELEIIVEEKMELRRKDEEKVKTQNGFLQDAKRKLAFKAEETARYNQSNIDMENRMKELGSTHDFLLSMTTYRAKQGRDRPVKPPPELPAIMAQLTKQVEEARENLMKERKERMRLVEERDEMQQHMDDTKQDATETLAEFNRRIKEGKARHDALTKEGAKLYQQVKDMDLKMAELKVEYERETEEFGGIKKDRSEQIHQLKGEISQMQIEKTKMEEELASKQPSFIKLEGEFQEAEQEYEARKKKLVALKNKKLQLDDSVKQIRRDMEKLENPREENKAELKKLREESMKQLKQTTKETKTMEEEIFEMGCKLKVAMEENARFIDANEKIEAEIKDMAKQMSSKEELLLSLMQEIINHKNVLEASWIDDLQMTEVFCARDQQLLVQIGELLGKTKYREGIVKQIGDKLDLELQSLGDFLKDVEKRRPTDSASELTPVVSNKAMTPMPPGVRPPSHMHARGHPSSRALRSKLSKTHAKLSSRVGSTPRRNSPQRLSTGQSIPPPTAESRKTSVGSKGGTMSQQPPQPSTASPDNQRRSIPSRHSPLRSGSKKIVRQSSSPKRKPAPNSSRDSSPTRAAKSPDSICSSAAGEDDGLALSSVVIAITQDLTNVSEGYPSQIEESVDATDTAAPDSRTLTTAGGGSTAMSDTDKSKTSAESRPTVEEAP